MKSHINRHTETVLMRDTTYISIEIGAAVAQRVKRWPNDLVVPSSIPAGGRIFSTVNGVPLHKAFHYQSLIVLI